MSRSRPFPRLLATIRLLAAALLATVAGAQAPAPGGSAAPAAALWREGAELLDREDPVAAWQVFRRALDVAAAEPPSQLGLGRVHLMLGRSDWAQRYAAAALAAEPQNQDGMALWVRALIRGRSFDAAVRSSQAYLQRTADPGAELLAARASALFRVQRTDDAAAVYREVLGRDPLHAEAHLRLGSGLLPPRMVAREPALVAAVRAAQRGEFAAAIAPLAELLQRTPDHPVAHRLLGETLFAQRAAQSMAATDPAFAALQQALPPVDVRHLPIGEFVRGFAQLAPARRRVVERAVALFGPQLPKLLALGGSHDLLLELDRTTDAEARATLRGKRTFDGRVWDDVRGIGGIHAATGIEALDEAATFGFDTFAHELAHQVHYFAFTPVQRVRVKQLYERAMAENRCLDYYAASNEMEYFGQGVEAFHSLGKRPGSETTHGHTRFELYRLDPGLHDFVAEVVAHDPLRTAAREPLLAAAAAVALRCGRPEDALVAAGWLPPGPRRQQWLHAAQAAAAAARCH